MTALQRVQTKAVKQIRRKTPITLQRLHVIERSVSAYSYLELEFFTLCRTLHNGLLRAAEGVELRVSDLVAG